MKSNTSSAVMNQRKEPSNSLDDFPSPPWGTRALCETLVKQNGQEFAINKMMTVHEPACGRGYMAEVLKEYFGKVHASDIWDYGYAARHDYLSADKPPYGKKRPHWIITNPPFNLAEKFITKALSEAKLGVAMLERLSFIEGKDRYARLFKARPPRYVMPFVERLPMVRGRVDENVSSATCYAWFVWLPLDLHNGTTEVAWIPPCRKQLEREGDYAGDKGVETPVITQRFDFGDEYNG